MEEPYYPLEEPLELLLSNKLLPDRLRKPRYPWKSGPPARPRVSRALTQSVPRRRPPTQSPGRHRRADWRPTQRRGTCQHNREKRGNGKLLKRPPRTSSCDVPRRKARGMKRSAEGSCNLDRTSRMVRLKLRLATAGNRGAPGERRSEPGTEKTPENQPMIRNRGAEGCKPQPGSYAKRIWRWGSGAARETDAIGGIPPSYGGSLPVNQRKRLVGERWAPTGHAWKRKEKKAAWANSLAVVSCVMMRKRRGYE